LLALAVPLLDTILSFVRRIRNGTPIFDADKRMKGTGCSQRRRR
jgi:hypothetical protein